MKKVAGVVAGVAVVGLLCFRSHGQNEPAPSSDAPIVVTNVPKPQTKLEAIAAAKGELLVKGYTDIGTLQGEDGSSVRVTAVEIADQSRGTRQTGIAIQVTTRNRDRGATSLIDSEDVKSLLDSIDSIAKIDHAVTRMGDFESSYRTRGDLEIANIRTGNGRVVTITATQILSPSGLVLTGTAPFRVSRLPDLRQSIVAAQDALDQSKLEDK
jgi:hypothetical protein